MKVIFSLKNEAPPIGESKIMFPTVEVVADFAGGNGLLRFRSLIDAEFFQPEEFINRGRVNSRQKLTLRIRLGMLAGGRYIDWARCDKGVELMQIDR